MYVPWASEPKEGGKSNQCRMNPPVTPFIYPDQSRPDQTLPYMISANSNRADGSSSVATVPPFSSAARRLCNYRRFQACGDAATWQDYFLPSLSSPPCFHVSLPAAIPKVQHYRSKTLQSWAIIEQQT